MDAEYLKRAVERDNRLVGELCERIGYGNVMDTAARLWLKKDKLGAHTVGPCNGLLVPCGCDSGQCDWCCGTGRITELVFEVRAGASEMKEAP